LKDLANDVQKKLPEAWSIALQRRVQSPEGYARCEFQAMIAMTAISLFWNDVFGDTEISGVTLDKQAAAYFARIGMRLPRGPEDCNLQTAVNGIMPGSVSLSPNPARYARSVATAEGLRLGWPTWYVSESLASALLMTKTPEGMALGEIKYPLDFMSFYLPLSEEMQRLTMGRRVPYIWVAKKRGYFLLSFTCFEKSKVGGETLVDYGLVLKLEDPVERLYVVKSRFNSITPDDNGFDYTISAEASESDKEESKMFLAKMSHLAVSLVISLGTRGQQLSENGAELRKERLGKRGEVKQDSLWSPNWLGRTYSHRHERGDGTHASPRAHWRCGHWRKQHYGPRPWTSETPFDLIWIEPVLVNPA
jgi:hypothetical protein